MTTVDIPLKRVNKNSGNVTAPICLPQKITRACFQSPQVRHLAKFGKKAVRLATVVSNAFPEDTSVCWRVLLEAARECGDKEYLATIEEVEKNNQELDLLLRYVT